MKTTYGYIRISTPKQDIRRQAQNIKNEYPEAIIISEVFTGKTQTRPKWERIKKKIQPGDVLVFDEISRMSRNAAEGFQDYKELYNKGVNLIFLKEPLLNSSNFKQAEAAVEMTGTEVDIILEAVNSYLMLLAEQQIKTAFELAEKEVDLIRQRTKEGLERARAEGKQIGRPKGMKLETKKGKITQELIKKHCRDYGGTLTDREVMTLAGVSKKTFYKYKALVREAWERGEDIVDYPGKP